MTLTGDYIGIAETCEDLNKKGLCNGDCCGIVPIKPQTLYRNRHLYQKEIKKQYVSADGIYPITDDGFCIFLARKKRKCMIYKDRPEICRMYGKISELQCPRIKPDGTVRTKKEQEQMHKKIAFDIDKQMERIGERCQKNH